MTNYNIKINDVFCGEIEEIFETMHRFSFFKVLSEALISFFFISVTPLKMLKGRGKSKGRGSSANSSHSVSSSASNSPSSMSVENQLKCQTMLCSLLRVQANDKYCATKFNKLIYSRRHAAFNNWVVKLCLVVIIQINYYQKTSSPQFKFSKEKLNIPIRDGLKLQWPRKKW